MDKKSLAALVEEGNCGYFWSLTFRIEKKITYDLFGHAWNQGLMAFILGL